MYSILDYNNEKGGNHNVFLIAKEYAEVNRIKNWAQQVKLILASCNLMCWWDKNASTDLTI